MNDCLCPPHPMTRVSEETLDALAKARPTLVGYPAFCALIPPAGFRVWPLPIGNTVAAFRIEPTGDVSPTFMICENPEDCPFSVGSK